MSFVFEMNYLSHYYAGGQIDEPNFTFGLVLPDMARVAHKELRFKNQESGTFSQPALQHIQKGVNHHLQTDLDFHKNEVFERSVQELKQIGLETGLADVKRLYFLAHITAEVVLDAILLKKQPSLVHVFYQQLSKVEALHIQLYFEAHHQQVHFQSFQNIFQKFTNARFLYQYQTEEGLAYALNRIYFKATHSYPVENYLELIPFVNASILHLESCWQGLLD